MSRTQDRMGTKSPKRKKIQQATRAAVRRLKKRK